MRNHPKSDRRSVLLICFAYERDVGSEPGVGFTTAETLARRYDVTVVTDRAWPGMNSDPTPGPDRPAVLRIPASPWPSFIDPTRSQRRWELYYYAWMKMVARRLPDLVRETGADLVQHVTYARYWMPSVFDTAGRPFIWGPVGGGESPSNAMMTTLEPHIRFSEYFRAGVRALFERDPAVSRTGRAADLALATTPESAARMRRFTDAPLEVHPAVCLSSDTIRKLGALPSPPDGPVRFLAVGRLLGWKGFDLALDALARAKTTNATLSVIGDGPERKWLEKRARERGLGTRVTFHGWLDRATTLERLAQGHVLVHPSLHDSGGMVCLEAMAAGRPVLCLAGNGPAFLCGDAAVVVPMGTREQTVEGLAQAMDRLASDRAWREELGRCGIDRIAAEHTAEKRMADLEAYYKRFWRSSANRSRHAA